MLKSRGNTAGPKLSDYVKYGCSGNSAQMKELLTRANGLRGVVDKTRHLYIVGQTRVHIDQVWTRNTVARFIYSTAIPVEQACCPLNAA